MTIKNDNEHLSAPDSKVVIVNLNNNLVVLIGRLSLKQDCTPIEDNTIRGFRRVWDVQTYWTVPSTLCTVLNIRSFVLKWRFLWKNVRLVKQPQPSPQLSSWYSLYSTCTHNKPLYIFITRMYKCIVCVSMTKFSCRGCYAIRHEIPKPNQMWRREPENRYFKPYSGCLRYFTPFWGSPAVSRISYIGNW